MFEEGYLIALRGDPQVAQYARGSVSDLAQRIFNHVSSIDRVHHCHRQSIWRPIQRPHILQDRSRQLSSETPLSQGPLSRCVVLAPVGDDREFTLGRDTES